MNRSTFSGWNPGFKKVSMIQLLRDHADRSLSEAKGKADAILESQTVTVDVRSSETAEHILYEAKKLGVIASRTTAGALEE